jgi:hypothetical protein
MEHLTVGIDGQSIDCGMVANQTIDNIPTGTTDANHADGDRHPIPIRGDELGEWTWRTLATTGRGLEEEWVACRPIYATHARF